MPALLFEPLHKFAATRLEVLLISGVSAAQIDDRRVGRRKHAASEARVRHDEPIEPQLSHAAGSEPQTCIDLEAGIAYRALKRHQPLTRRVGVASRIDHGGEEPHAAALRGCHGNTQVRSQWCE